MSAEILLHIQLVNRIGGTSETALMLLKFICTRKLLCNPPQPFISSVLIKLLSYSLLSLMLHLFCTGVLSLLSSALAFQLFDHGRLRRFQNRSLLQNMN